MSEYGTPHTVRQSTGVWVRVPYSGQSALPHYMNIPGLEVEKWPAYLDDGALAIKLRDPKPGTYEVRVMRGGHNPVRRVGTVTV